MKKLLSIMSVKLVTSILTLAVTITGVSFGNTTTANAAKNEPLSEQNSDAVTTYTYNPYDDMGKLQDLKDTTLTMKFKATPKRVYAPDSKYGTNKTSRYIWTCSDETVVNMKRIYALTGDEFEPYYLSLSYISLRPLEPGTAIISATNPEDNTTISFTVNVKGPKITAKQKSCMHKFKTTTKATCERPGLKTCKKCDLQKKVKKAAHKYEKENEWGPDVIDVEFEVFCNDGCDLDTTVRLSDYATAEEIRHAHYVETSDGTRRIEWTITGVSDSIKNKYGKAVNEAMNRHSSVLGNWLFGGRDIYGDEIVFQETKMVCKKCGKEKQ